MQGFLNAVSGIAQDSGFAGIFDFANKGYLYLIMIVVACVLLYLAIV